MSEKVLDNANANISNEKILNIGVAKKQYKLSNGNYVMLDPGDLNIVKRAQEVSAEMEQLQTLAEKLSKDSSVETAVIELEKAHQQMCEKVNYIFDSDVSSACCGNANMFDMQDGLFRFERIISGLLNAFEENIQRETKAAKSRMTKAKEKYKRV